MSSTPPSGWWQASDGNWYPPEQHPEGPEVAYQGWWQASDGNWYPPAQHPDPGHRARFARPEADGAGATGKPPAGASTGGTTSPAVAGPGRRLVLVGIAVAAVLLVGGTAVAFFAREPAPEDALLTGISSLDEPATMTFGLEGSLDYDALPPGEAADARAAFGIAESVATDARVTVAHDARRIYTAFDVGGLTAFELDVDTVTPEEALEAARDRGGDPPEQVVAELEGLQRLPEAVTARVDLDAFAALDDGAGPMGPDAAAGLGFLHPMLEELAGGQPVAVTEVAWVWVAVSEAFQELATGEGVPLDEDELESLVRDLVEASRDYYDEHVSVTEVDEPAPEGVPENARPLEVRVPVPEALEALADRAPTIAELFGDDPAMPAAAEIEAELRDAASRLEAGGQPVELRLLAWIDGDHLVGASLPLGDLVDTWANGLAAIDPGDPFVQDAAEVSSVLNDMALTMTVEPGGITAEPLEATSSADLTELVNDVGQLGGTTLEPGREYPDLLDLLRPLTDPTQLPGPDPLEPDQESLDLEPAPLDPEGARAARCSPRARTPRRSWRATRPRPPSPGCRTPSTKRSSRPGSTPRSRTTPATCSRPATRSSCATGPTRCRCWKARKKTTPARSRTTSTSRPCRPSTVRAP
nr:hypothetical protein [Egibacter rhizosphaerae]